MERNGRKIVIIGGGIAGLSAAVYALKCGYDVEVLEMHDMAGGLAMSWKRGDYTFETCLHWLVGSRPGGEFHEMWQEVCDIEKLTFVDPEVFARIEDERGGELNLYTDPDRLEAELLAHAPQDEAPIRALTHGIRSLRKFKIVEPSRGLAGNWRGMLQDVPIFPLLSRLTKMSGKEYGSRFSDSMLRNFFSMGDVGKLPAIAMVLSLAWMGAGNAGYCIGGSQALIRLIEEKIAALGGKIRYKARVRRVLVESDTAVGVQLANGELVRGDWVVSAADGHTTVFELLGGRYIDPVTQKQYQQGETFASYLQVSLGVARDLSGEPPMVSRILEIPIVVDPETTVEHLGFRFFHFDPTFAPVGKTAVTCILPTRNFRYWNELRRNAPMAYYSAKNRIAETVIGVLERRMPGIRAAVETVDVSTPATVMRYTGNWCGSQEGWLFKPGDGMRMLPNHLPGLKQFMMVGQWIMPGGGLPSGPMTARPTVKAICRADRVRFDVAAETPVHEEEAVGV
ncbi:phytoene desaturase family protein [Occallatibacter riparius]|uniref:NAD(P)/FAD-dependent oxidoreductase n=1 Tax=Occallatibacter riparius TaxID=1002689 RepID=A0A9J7BSF4_9BACT|nr:NAD(P)/FAD-dependent oxidoreductase [Occallatibacter riparius]UWZ83838.1 NAD(P)/FAD-dependent oxidoreductase [Occallatibacter riparius]